MLGRYLAAALAVGTGPEPVFIKSVAQFMRCRALRVNMSQNFEVFEFQEGSVKNTVSVHHRKKCQELGRWDERKALHFIGSLRICENYGYGLHFGCNG